MAEPKQKDLVREQIDRCVELYANDIVVAEEISRDSYEQMRADLLLAVGMLSALHALGTAESAQ